MFKTVNPVILVDEFLINPEKAIQMRKLFGKKIIIDEEVYELPTLKKLRRAIDTRRGDFIANLQKGTIRGEKGRFISPKNLQEKAGDCTRLLQSLR